MAGAVTRNAEAIADFTFEKTLSFVFVGTFLQVTPEPGLQKSNAQAVNPRHPHKGTVITRRRDGYRGRYHAVSVYPSYRDPFDHGRDQTGA